MSEQRTRLAAMAMQGILSNEALINRIREDMLVAIPELRDNTDPDRNSKHRQATFKSIAKISVEQADYLLAALAGTF